MPVDAAFPGWGFLPKTPEVGHSNVHFLHSQNQ
jgi:hypothetical protein